MGTTPLIVLDVGGLSADLLETTPRLRTLGERGFRAELHTVMPALAAPVQATFLTGLLPSEHGIVGEVWYDGRLGEVRHGTAARGLLTGETLWEAVRRAAPGHRLASLCWRFGLGAGADLTVAPLPLLSDVYTSPPVLHDRLTAEFGPWPGESGLKATVWVAGAARHLLETDAPDLLLVSLPLHGPDAQAVDAAVGQVADAGQEAGATVVALSGYRSMPVHRRVDLNALLRAEGLATLYRSAGSEHPDPWASRAFALPDHQLAHVYVRAPGEVPHVAALLRAQPGVADVLETVAHHRAGELLAVAEPHAWFAAEPPTVPRRRLGRRAAAPPLFSHGHPRPGPVLLCSDRSIARDVVAATDVKALLLEAAHLHAPVS